MIQNLQLMLLCQSSLTRIPLVQAYRDSLRISFQKGHPTRSFVPILARTLSELRANTPNDFPSSAHETLALVDKAINLLPRALNIKRTSVSTRTEETANFWNTILSSVREDLLATTKRPAKIVGSCIQFTSFLFLNGTLTIYFLSSMWRR